VGIHFFLFSKTSWQKKLKAGDCLGREFDNELRGFQRLVGERKDGRSRGLRGRNIFGNVEWRPAFASEVKDRAKGEGGSGSKRSMHRHKYKAGWTGKHPVIQKSKMRALYGKGMYRWGVRKMRKWSRWMYGIVPGRNDREF